MSKGAQTTLTGLNRAPGTLRASHFPSLDRRVGFGSRRLSGGSGRIAKSYKT